MQLPEEMRDVQFVAPPCIAQTARGTSETIARPASRPILDCFMRGHCPVCQQPEATRTHRMYGSDHQSGYRVTVAAQTGGNFVDTRGKALPVQQERPFLLPIGAVAPGSSPQSHPLDAHPMSIATPRLSEVSSSQSHRSQALWTNETRFFRWPLPVPPW